MPTPNVDGIDISHWNLVSDESRILPMKLMSCKATEGPWFESPTFTTYWAMFKRLGARYRGAYHWVRSDSTARAQVDNLARALDRVGGLQVGDFIQLDWERTYRPTGELVADPTVALIEEWIRLAELRWGDRIIVYGSDWVPNFLAWRKRNPLMPIWYANYNTGTGPTHGWAECAKYNAAVWQWTSVYKMPGFSWNPDDPLDGIDVNHVFDWGVLDRLTLQGPLVEPASPVPEEETMQSVIYHVWSDTVAGAFCWIKVNDDDTARVVANGQEYQLLLSRGSVHADPESTAHFREMLATYQPIGNLTENARAVLGAAAAADWDARAYRNAPAPLPIVIPPIEVPPAEVHVTFPDSIAVTGNFNGAIT
jgi:GH25 family lysozyme M1 (1,4-beta-N-acetylmuramidase)